MIKAQLSRLLSFFGIIFRKSIHFLAKQPPRRLFLIGTVLAFISIIFYVLITALHHALFFDGYAANGAFQLMNPLRRLAEGEVIGSDFNFFHGVGVPLLHLPFYFLFGQGLFGSEMARWLVSPVLFAAAAYCFFYFFKRSALFASAMTAWVTALSLYIMPSISLPRNSMLGVRSVVAVFLMVVILRQEWLKKLWSHKRFFRFVSMYEIVVALLLAVGFICGTEFGVGAILAYAVVAIIYKTDASTLLARVLSVGRIIGLAAAWLLALLTAITRGNPLEPFKYALVEIPMDQFWYFGVPPNKFLHSENIFSVLTKDEKFLWNIALALVALALVVAVHRLRTHRVQTQAFLFGLGAGAMGMVSMLGYYHYTETTALARMSLQVGSAALVVLALRWRRPVATAVQVGKFKRQLRFTPYKGLYALALLFVAAAGFNMAASLASLRSEYDVTNTVIRATEYVRGEDTNLLGDEWRAVEEGVMRVVNADNTLPVADVTNLEYLHGIHISEPKLMLDAAGDKLAFIQPGQTIYLDKAGRQIIKSVEKQRSGRVVVTLQNEKVTLNTTHDGAPGKVIFAERFDRDDTRMWSLYSGLLEQEAGIFNPTKEGYDYIIHALGPDRRAEYVREFKQTKPEFVLTLRKNYFIYEDWVQTLHWDFYSLLDQNYEVARENSIYVIWQRRDLAWSNAHTQAGPWQQLTVDNKTQQIALPELDFSKVPDMNMYERKVQKMERKLAISLGRKPPGMKKFSPEEYDQRLLDRQRARSELKVWRQENSGVDSEEAEKQAWLEAIETHKSTNELMNRLVRPLPRYVEAQRPKRQVILIKLTYNVSHPLAKLPILGKTTRYFVEPNRTYSTTPISLRPYAHETIFPIVLSEFNQDPYLQLKSYGLLPGEGRLDIKKIEWTLLDTSVPNLKALTE
jgi:hypothetical protein